MDSEKLPIMITGPNDGQYVLRIDTDMASGVYVPGGGTTFGLSDTAMALLRGMVFQSCDLADQVEVIAGFLREAGRRPEVQSRIRSMLRDGLDDQESQSAAA